MNRWAIAKGALSTTRIDMKRSHFPPSAIRDRRLPLRYAALASGRERTALVTLEPRRVLVGVSSG